MWCTSRYTASSELDSAAAAYEDDQKQKYGAACKRDKSDIKQSNKLIEAILNESDDGPVGRTTVNMATTVTQPSIARPLPESASKTYVTCAPVPAYSSTTVMETQRQQPQPQKAHSMMSTSDSRTITATNCTNITPPLARHCRPAGSSPQCQNVPLDLTKPLDLSVKKKRPRSVERICDDNFIQCYRQINVDGGLDSKNSVPVIPPFNFGNINDTTRLNPFTEHADGSSRRTGLIGSSPRNYNYRGKAVVAPRRDHTPGHQPQQQQRQFVDLQREASTIKHGHVPVCSSVPYSRTTHPFSQTSSFTVSSSLSSSGHMFPPSSQVTPNSTYRNAHRNRPLLPNSTERFATGVHTKSVSSSSSEKHATPARIAHVTAFSRTSPATASRGPSSQSPLSASYGVPSDNFTVGMLQGNSPSAAFQSSPGGSQSNGTLTVTKKMRRSHSVSPMRLSRNTYGKGNDRHNVRVLRMLDSTIAAGAKITKFLPPIDGPEAPRILSHSSSMIKHDSNNNDNHPLRTYNQPLRVDIPEQHSPSMPPTLPRAFVGEDRRIPSADHIDSSTYCPGLDQLSPPSNRISDRISPTMPVLVPHSVYSPSPVELPRPESIDSSLPILKKAKLDINNATPSQSVFNALTLPFLSSMTESKKVQSVPPIISQPREMEEARHARYAQHSRQHPAYLTSAEMTHGRTQMTRGDALSVEPSVGPYQKELENLLMQLGRKATQSLSVERPNFSSPTAPVLAQSVPSMKTSVPYPKLTRPTVARTHRTFEEDREIIRRLMLQKRAIQRRKQMEKHALISNRQKQEPEIVDLTASPPPSPIEIKQEEQIEQPVCKDKVPVLPKVPQVTSIESPEQTDISRARSIFRTPPLGVVGKTLTMKEAIERALESSFFEDSKTEERDAAKSDCARPISLVLNSKSESASAGNLKGSESNHSFCQKHRRLLFPSIEPTNKATKIPVSDYSIIPRTTTLSDVINHFITHDPRKKHLASLKQQPEALPSSPMTKEGEAPTTSSSIAASTSGSLPFSNVTAEHEQRRGRRLNTEISRIANTASYVGDLPKKPRTGDLLVDSSLLDREERALQVVADKSNIGEQCLEETFPLNLSSSKRAMLRFSEMEQQARFGVTSNSMHQDTATKPNFERKKRRPVRRRPPRGRGRGLNRAAKLVKVGRRRRFPWRLTRHQLAKRESPRKRKLQISSQTTDTITDNEKSAKTLHHKFLDFKPEILESRTRNEGNSLDIKGVENRNVEETPSVPQNEPVQPKFGERGRNSVRKRMPYHKNARYELEIEKEEAKLVERKRKRTVSYSGSNSGADTTDESLVVPPAPVITPVMPVSVSPPAMPLPDSQPVKRKRGRPRKTEAEKALTAKRRQKLVAKRRQIKAKYNGVNRSKYPLRTKKTVPKNMKKPTNANVKINKDTSPFIKEDLQRPLQVVIDPDNHTKMRFVSVKPNAKMGVPARGKRKRKTKHLGPVSPSQRENIENCNGGDSKMITNDKEDDALDSVQIKQEPIDVGFEMEPVPNQPPPVQIVRPDPPADFKKLICNKKLGETVLHRACRMARDDVAIYCIDYQLCDLNAKDNAGYTPLHECCVNDRLEVAEHLLRHGADANASAADGTRPIHDAVDNHRMDIVRLLLAFGADPLVATYSGRTALKLARNQQMRAFIIGYLRDVNGEWELDEDEYPEYVDAFRDTDWRFRNSIDISLDCISASDVDVIGEIPTDDTPIEDSGTPDDDVMFEFSETPHLQTYNLQLARDNGPRNWLLVADVRKALGGKLDDVINTCEDVEPITITRREFNYALKEGLASLPADFLPKVHGHVSDSETVELVQLNGSIRQALDIDTEFVS